MKEIDQIIVDAAAEHFDQILDIRRHIHMNPELSFEEKETSKFVSSMLKSMGLEVKEGIGGYGLTALIKGAKEGPCLGLRADMDALPIQEANAVPYASKVKGVMHACGHDVHTASLLGTAMILNALKANIAGSVKLIFQPGEEKIPGGASLMIKDGILENPKVDFMLGQHVFPDMDAGCFGVCPGPYMASADEVYIRIKGKGGHGAMPHKCIDPIVLSAQIISAIQSLVSRNTNPLEPLVITMGKINSLGGATNIIPDVVSLEGTIRTLNEEVRRDIHAQLKALLEGYERSSGATIELEIRRGYPSLTNDLAISNRVLEIGQQFKGVDRFKLIPKRMTAEDFAYFSNAVPSCFYRMGVRNEAKGIVSGVHTNTFDIDEEALKHSSAMMAFLAISLLKV